MIPEEENKRLYTAYNEGIRLGMTRRNACAPGTEYSKCDNSLPRRHDSTTVPSAPVGALISTTAPSASVDAVAVHGQCVISPVLSPINPAIEPGSGTFSKAVQSPSLSGSHCIPTKPSPGPAGSEQFTAPKFMLHRLHWQEETEVLYKRQLSVPSLDCPFSS